MDKDNDNELRKLFDQADVLTLMAELDEKRREFYDRIRMLGIRIAFKNEAWWWYIPTPESHCLDGFSTFGEALWDALRVYFMFNERPPHSPN